VPPAFAPGGGVYDWTRASERAAAESACNGRIAGSFNTTVGLQTLPTLTNVKEGFFLVYINSFNEWHEGHQFEPARNRADESRHMAIKDVLSMVPPGGENAAGPSGKRD
jgi:hypothetical protein